MSRVEAAVLIAAAGVGTRLGLGPKAFVRVRGFSLLELSLQAVVGRVAEVVVALPAAEVAGFRASRGDVTVVAGGATRQESVANMLAVTRSQLVLVHDVARPFLTPEVILRVAHAARATGAATAVLDVADSVFDVETGSTVPRAGLRLVQTPQGFDRQVLVEAHAAAKADGFTATDDAELVRRLGRQVALVQGSRLLGKITGPEDMPLAAALHDLWLVERGALSGGG